MKYPTESSLGSPAMKAERRKKYDAHFKKYSTLYKSIKDGCGSEGACVPIEDYFRDGVFYYTVYQKINADTLALEDISKLSSKEKYRLLLRLVQGLQPLHTQGVIHGDLKPENILVQKDGDNWRIRLIDMNDCYHAGDPNPPGEVVGTPDYYSPELTEYNTYEIEDYDDPDEMSNVRALAKALTTKSDIFALGIIFCEFFCGKRPIIKSDDIENIAEASVAGSLDFPSEIPTDFAELLSQMLAPMPKDRPGLTIIANKLKDFISGHKSVLSPKFTIIKKTSKEIEVEISCSGATKIYYTLDGSTPTNKSPIYEGKLKLVRTTCVKCVVESDEGRLGKVYQETFAIGRLRLRVSSKSPSIKVSGRTISMFPDTSSSEGTEIYYTTDGSKPTISSNIYKRPFIVPKGTVRVSAIAREPEDNKMVSAVVHATIYKPKLNAPIIHYSKGCVSMESSDDANIYYSVDGEAPTIGSILYEGPFIIEDTSKFIIKAICIKDEYINSEIAEIKRPNLIMSK